MSKDERGEREYENRGQKQKMTKIGEKKRKEMREEQIKEKTACHPTVTSHNLLCSGP